MIIIDKIFYLLASCTVTNASETLFNDICLICSINTHKSDNKKKNKKVYLAKFLNHLWILNKEYTILVIFDDRIPLEIRKFC